ETFLRLSLGTLDFGLPPLCKCTRVLLEPSQRGAQGVLVVAPPAIATLLALTLCPCVLILPARPSLLGLQECPLLDFGLRTRNDRFPVITMLLGFAKLASLRLALGPLVLDPPRPPFLGLAPQ